MFYALISTLTCNLQVVRTYKLCVVDERYSQFTLTDSIFLGLARRQLTSMQEIGFAKILLIEFVEGYSTK